MKEARGTPRSKSGKNQISEGVEEQDANDSVALGDVIYIKLPSGSWWPAQVIDDESVALRVKPGRRFAGGVLVRLYGSYTYLYADPVRSRAEFEMILQQNNGDLRKILEEALEKDLPSTNPCTRKRSSLKTKGTPSKRSTCKRKSSKQDKEQNDGDLGSQSHETASGKSQELSSRRIRVMESLGLIAPPGSPFIRGNNNNYN